MNPVLTLELIPSLLGIGPGVSDVVESSSNVQRDVGKSFVTVQVVIIKSSLIRHIACSGIYSDSWTRDSEDVRDAYDGEDGLDEISPSPIVVSSEFWNVNLGESWSSGGSRNDTKKEDEEEPESFTGELMKVANTKVLLSDEAQDSSMREI